MEISEKITYLRKQKGWSQEQLAIKVEVSRQAVYKWEAGISQPEIDKLKKLSSLFCVSFDELLNDEIDITKPKVAENITIEPKKEDDNNVGQEKEISNEDFQGSNVAPIINEENGTPKRNGDNKKLWTILIAVITAFVVCVCAIGILLIKYLLPDNERENQGNSSSSSITNSSDDKEEQNGSTTQSSMPSNDKPDNEDNSNEPEAVYYTVKFETEGGTQIPNIRVKKGDLIPNNIHTTYEGHTFLGWVNLDTFMEWDLQNDRVYSDITLCAFWMTESLVPVTYHKNDGSGEAVTVYEDASELVLLCDVFFDEEKTLIGWSISPDGPLMFNIDEEIYISEPLTLYAVWEEKEEAYFEFVANQDGGLTLISYMGRDLYVEIPAYYDGKPVTRIASYAFSGNEHTKIVAIPNTVLKILNDAFNNSYVEEIYLPDSVYSIDVTSFNGCYTLLNIYVDEGNGYFSSIDGVLYNKEQTRLVKYPVGRVDGTYNLPDGTHYVNDYAFYECAWLVEVVIPDGCGGIGVSTFEGCSSLVSIDVGNRIDYVGGRAFYNCHSLESIVFEYDLYSIGKEAFFNCYALETVVIKGNVGIISYHTFGNCMSLTTVMIGGEIKDELNEYAFEGSHMFTGITYT